jgi:hypothetical protein
VNVERKGDEDLTGPIDGEQIRSDEKLLEWRR